MRVRPLGGAMLLFANQSGLTSRRSLLIGDQIALLKGATFEVMEIRFNMVFNTKTGLWECGHATYCIEDAERGAITHLYISNCLLLIEHPFLLALVLSVLIVDEI